MSVNNNLNLDNKCGLKDSKKQDEQNSGKQSLLSYIRDLIIILLIAMFVKNYVISPFQISGQSMYDSYYDKEFIIVDGFSYNFLKKEPKRGDVVVFSVDDGEEESILGEIVSFFPFVNNKKYFIKRIIGLPGETLKIASGRVFVKTVGSNEFVELDEKYLNEANYKATYVRGDPSEKIYQVPEGSYFVMGDNRNASTDSRTCFSSCEIGNRTNYVPRKNIVGKVLMDLGYFDFKTFSYMNPDLGIETRPRWFSSPSSFDYK